MTNAAHHHSQIIDRYSIHERIVAKKPSNTQVPETGAMPSMLHLVPEEWNGAWL